MLLLIFEAHEASTIFAFVSASTTLLFMVRKLFNLEKFSAISALLRPHFTMVFMITEGKLFCFETTVLAGNFNCTFFVVLFFVSFGHNLATYFALVVHSGTTNLVHAELGYLDISLTSWTFFSFLNFNHVFVARIS